MPLSSKSVLSEGVGQTPDKPQTFELEENEVELSNMNFRVLNEAVELLNSISRKSKYFTNLDINDVMFATVYERLTSLNTRVKAAVLWLRNGLIVEADEERGISITASMRCGYEG